MYTTPHVNAHLHRDVFVSKRNAGPKRHGHSRCTFSVSLISSHMTQGESHNHAREGGLYAENESWPARPVPKFAAAELVTNRGSSERPLGEVVRDLLLAFFE